MRKTFGFILLFVLMITLSLPMNKEDRAHAATDGDSIDSAIPVGVNETIRDTTRSNGYVYYKLTIPSNGQLTAEMTNTPSEYTVVIMNEKTWIYNKFNTSNNQSESSSASVGLEKDAVVYVKVYSNEESPFELRLSFKAGDYYEKEFNDEIFYPNTIKPNSITSGIVRTNDIDYYKFTIDKPGKVEIKMNNQGEKHVILKKTLQNDLTSFSTTDGLGATSSYIGLPEGTHYIKVEQDGSEDLPYTLELKYTASDYFETEWNNMASAADPIQLNKIYQGYAGASNDYDYYSINITERQAVKFSLKSATEANASIRNEDNFEIYEMYAIEDTAIQTLTLNPGKYYIRVYGFYDGNDLYSISAQTFTPNLLLSKIKISNNIGKNDTIAVSGTQKGDTIKIYDKSSGGKLLASQKSNGSSVTLSIKQLGTKAGKVYVSNTKSDYLESSRTAVTFNAEPSVALKTSQIKITNNRAKNDVIKVSGVKKGDTIKVYDKSSGGKLLVSKKTTGTSVELAVKQLSQKSGSIYVSTTNSGLLESSRTKVAYKAESSPSLKASQVTIKNNKKKSDAITVKSIKKGDVIKVYSKSSGGKLLVSKKSGGTSVTLSVKQLGTKAGSVYVSVTNSGLLESSRVKKSYKKE